MFAWRLPVLLCALLGGAEASYGQPPCAPNEVLGEVLGAPGRICAPRCDAATLACPADVPVGSSAQPQCMLQDISQSALCGLLCQADAQCPTGSQCKQLAQAGASICLFPVSFTDWASSGVQAQKLAFGWPSRAGQKGPSIEMQISKTSAALQSMKIKYNIQEGDADMQSLKDLLTSLAASPAPQQAAAAVPGAAVPVVSASPEASELHDVAQFEKYVSMGLPGLEKEVYDTVWNIEHLDQPSAATHLLTGLLWVCAIYCVVGAFFKYQQGAQGVNMIPHVGFWATYPGLVNDGVRYSKILLGLEVPAGRHDDFLSGSGVGRGHYSKPEGEGAFDQL